MMTTKIFVDRMNMIHPKVTEEAKKAFSTEFVNKHLLSFRFDKRAEFEEHQNDFVNLIKNYDCSNVEIGMLSFLTEPVVDNKYIYVGKYEFDDIVIDRISNSIFLKEFNTNHILCGIAIDASSFFDALYIVTIHIAMIPLGAEIEGEQKTVCNVANKCSLVAGGKDFLQFYNMLLGCCK